MSRIAEFNRITQGAKQQRAELIGATVKAQARPIVIAVALALALTLATSIPFHFEGQPVQLTVHVS